jgi:hypothetical protein
VICGFDYCLTLRVLGYWVCWKLGILGCNLVEFMVELPIYPTNNY